jgi:hypothetical protein
MCYIIPKEQRQRKKNLNADHSGGHLFVDEVVWTWVKCLYE